MSSQKPILRVEDNPSDLDLTKRVLTRGYISNELLIAEDGQEALDYPRREGAFAGRSISEAPALILLDLELPKVPGLEVSRLSRADPRLRRIPVVTLTSSKEREDTRAGYDLGVNSYVRNPFDFKKFQIAIENLGLYRLLINEPFK